MIMLKSSDGITFEIEEAAARRSQLIAHMIEEGFEDIPIPLVNGKILALVTKYCKKHPVVPVFDDPTSDEDLKKWDEEFIMQIDDQSTIFDLLHAADYLGINSLHDLAYQAVWDMIKD
ncbi:PREDICTED: SKP1-like protein 10 [Camelina sativa]|uniref:SKP1-like protein 10 n=1 Tax=Camelina sativa TaxID=90675 RepID=A0ABM0TNW6_CAMSA|nr:PREDICTED: SKP1-like protein 10 [Camelina sativa]